MQNITKTIREETEDAKERNLSEHKPENIDSRESGQVKSVQEDACLYAFRRVYNDILNMVLSDQNIPYTARDYSYERDADTPIHTRLFCDEAEMKGEIRGRQIGKEIGLRMGAQSGLKEGEYNKLKSIVLKKRLRGYAVEEIADMLEEDMDTIEDIVRKLEERNA